MTTKKAALTPTQQKAKTLNIPLTVEKSIHLLNLNCHERTVQEWIDALTSFMHSADANPTGVVQISRDYDGYIDGASVVVQVFRDEAELVADIQFKEHSLKRQAEAEHQQYLKLKAKYEGK